MTAHTRDQVRCFKCIGEDPRCPQCSGTGWVYLHRALLDPRLFVIAAIVFGAAFVALILAIAVLS